MIFTAAQLSALPVLDTCDVLIAGGGEEFQRILSQQDEKITLPASRRRNGGISTLFSLPASKQPAGSFFVKFGFLLDIHPASRYNFYVILPHSTD